MSKVLIVSKTKMAQQKVCVGGIDVERHRSLRLMNENGYHETLEECPYNIFDVWDLEYIDTSTRPLPHSSEDVNVSQRKRVDILKRDIDLIDFLRKSGAKIYYGHIKNVFNGYLKSTGSGSLFISTPQVPNHSTCFWICDQDIVRKNHQGKIKFHYKDDNHTWGYNISYVGLEDDPVDIIPQGSLIRLSLAHWWSPGDTEERCYLQLSGYFLIEPHWS